MTDLSRGITQARRELARKRERAHDRAETWAMVLIAWSVVALAILAIGIMP